MLDIDSSHEHTSTAPGTVHREHAPPAAHAQQCDCAHHHRPPLRTRSGLWSAVAPALACAVCPACLSTYAKVLAVLGVGFALSERQHVAVLGVAVLFSVGIGARRSWRTRVVWPLAIAVVGCSLVVAGHFLGDVSPLEWLGVGVLLIGGLAERNLLARAPVAVAGASPS